MVTTPVGRPGAARRASTTSAAWPGRGAAGSRASTCRSTAGATGARAARRAGDGQVPDALQHRLGLGRQAGHRASRAWTTPATCSPPYRQNCARCAARARSITTTRSSRGWCRKTGGEECSGSRDGLLAVALIAASAARRRAGRLPGIGRAATPGSGGLGHRRAPRLQGLPRGQAGEPGPGRVGRLRASCHGIFGESNSTFMPLVAAPPPTTSRPAAWRA